MAKKKTFTVRSGRSGRFGESENKGNSNPQQGFGKVWAELAKVKISLEKTFTVGRVRSGRVGSGRLENLRIKLTQTLSRASDRFGLSLAIFLKIW